MSIHISNLRGKLADIQAISTNTTTNPYCIKQNAKGKATGKNICGECYSMASLTGYMKSMAPALQRNSDALASPIDDSDIPFINAAIFRFSAHGELINLAHFDNLMRIAKANPWVSCFALWTKRVDIVNRWLRNNDLPHNVKLIYSNPKIGHIMSKPPKGFHSTFNNVPKSDKRPQNCTGQKCRDCRLCYTFGHDVDTIVEAVK